MAFRALLLTSDSLRHACFVAECRNVFEIVDVICQKKRNYYSKARQESHVVRDHFARISEYEGRYFKNYQLSNIISVDDINDPELAKKYEGKVDVVLLYGTSILKDCWLDSFNSIVNLHLGLSPMYKGAATLFWPFLDDRLESLGTTIHLATSSVDAGDIIETITPDWSGAKINYYDSTTALILKSLRIYPHVVLKYLNKEIVPVPQDGSLNLRISTKKDFDEGSLVRVLEKYYLAKTDLV